VAHLLHTGLTDEAQIRTALEKEGYRHIFTWSDTAGTRYETHTHPHEEVRWVVWGKLVIVEEGVEIELGPGDKMTIEAEEPHSAYVLEDVRYLCGSR